MIRTIHIQNYKSITDLKLELGRFNVFIGENGAGKSNILEALALAGASQAGKLDNEFLSSRGIRVTDPQLMRSGFDNQHRNKPIRIELSDSVGRQSVYELCNDNAPYSVWEDRSVGSQNRGFEGAMSIVREISDANISNDLKLEFFASFKVLADQAMKALESGEKTATITLKTSDKLFKVIGTPYESIANFLIFSPENTALRMFEKEGQIEPLGINGEGILKFLAVLSSLKNQVAIKTIKDELKVFGWFEGMSVKKTRVRSKMVIQDQFLHPETPHLDQMSANEGFLFLVFYYALFVSDLTPNFFAIDNIDASLNPLLCRKLVERLVELSTSNSKQVIATTHNPAILDGLNISDDEQRLFVISRGPSGNTRVRRIKSKPHTDKTTRLSDMFVSGVLGGLPKSFI